MKKFLIFTFPFIVIVLIICSYEISNKESDEDVNAANVEQLKKDLIFNFFEDFQKSNDGWTKTTTGHQMLVKAFEKKMISELDFAKSCASYNMMTKHRFNSIRNSASISSYDKSDGEEGEVKAFDIIIEIPLIKPLYNGQKTIKVKYEIISTIPSTIEEHWKPYIDNVNYCGKFDSYLKSEYDGILNLGCYILTRKDS